MEQFVKREQVFKGKLLELRVDTVRLPDGKETQREVIVHPGAAVIVPVDSEEHVILVKQFRYAVGQESLELPAGTCEKGEAPEATARRELEEETGYRAGRFDSLGSFYSSPGILTEEMHVYLARDLAEGTSKPEGDEDLQEVKLTLDEAVSRVHRGEIHDGKTIIGLLLAQEKLSRMTTP